MLVGHFTPLAMAPADRSEMERGQDGIREADGRPKGEVRTLRVR